MAATKQWLCSLYPNCCCRMHDETTSNIPMSNVPDLMTCRCAYPHTPCRGSVYSDTEVQCLEEKVERRRQRMMYKSPGMPELAYYILPQEFQRHLKYPKVRRLQKKPKTIGHYLAATSASVALAPLFIQKREAQVIDKDGPPRLPPLPFIGQGLQFSMRSARRHWTWFRGSVDAKAFADWFTGRKSTAPWEKLPYETTKDNIYPSTERDRALAQALNDNWSTPESEFDRGVVESLTTTESKDIQILPPNFNQDLAVALNYKLRPPKIPRKIIRPRILVSDSNGSVGVITESPKKMTREAFFSSPLRRVEESSASSQAHANPAQQSVSARKDRITSLINSLPRTANGNIHVHIDCPIPDHIDPSEDHDMAEYHAKKWWKKRIDRNIHKGQKERRGRRKPVPALE